MPDLNALLLVAGPSGVGKSTLINSLCKQNPYAYEYPKIYTTRPPRPNETDKIQIDESFFKECSLHKLILCPNYVHGHYYGPAIDDVTKIIQFRKNPILDWPIDKVKTLQEQISPLLTFVIYLKPPSQEILEKRLSLDTRDTTGTRLQTALMELSDLEKGHHASIIDMLITSENYFYTNTSELHKNIITGIDRKIKTGGLNMDASKIKLKNDSYRSARGGEAHLLDLFCSKCQSNIMKYQKDGKGGLLRCYLNRIFFPPELEKLQYDHSMTCQSLPNLKCTNCNNLIGTPMKHDDGRYAFRLVPGSIYKKRIF